MSVPDPSPAARHEAKFDLVARLWGLAGLGATAYFWFAYSGPYRWFAELQLAWFGGYRPMLSGVLTLVLLTGVPVALSYLMLVRFHLLGVFDARRLNAIRDDASARRGTFGYLIAGLLCLGLSAAGAYGVWRGRGSDEHEKHAVASLSTREPRTRFVTLTGFLASESAFSYLEDRTRDVRHEYVPLVPTSWTRSDPVRVVVEYRTYGSEAETGSRAAGETSVSGTLHSLGIPGFLLERANLRFAPRHYVLVPGETPKETRSRGFSLIGLGVVLGGLVSGMTALVHRTGRSRT